MAKSHGLISLIEFASRVFFNLYVPIVMELFSLDHVVVFLGIFSKRFYGGSSKFVCYRCSILSTCKGEGEREREAITFQPKMVKIQHPCQSTQLYYTYIHTYIQRWSSPVKFS